MVVARRRRRRPRWLVLAGVLTVIVLAVSALAGEGDSSRRLAELAYVDEMRPHIERSSQQGADLADVMEKAPDLGRDGIVRRLERLRREAGEVLENVEAGEPPERVRSAHALLVSSMFLRAQAADALAEAFGRALGTESPRPAVEAMVASGEELVTADQAYQSFTRVLLSGEEGVGGLLPPSRWIAAPERWAEPEIGALISTLRSSATLAPVHDLAIVVMRTEPLAVGADGDTAILPPANALRVHVVVANVGNEAEREVPVVATLTREDGEPDTARQFVDLDPGQRVTVTLGGLIPRSGQLHTLFVRVEPRPGETNLADNQLRRTLQIR